MMPLSRPSPFAAWCGPLIPLGGSSDALRFVSRFLTERNQSPLRIQTGKNCPQLVEPSVWRSVVVWVCCVFCCHCARLCQFVQCPNGHLAPSLFPSPKFCLPNVVILMFFLSLLHFSLDKTLFIFMWRIVVVRTQRVCKRSTIETVADHTNLCWLPLAQNSASIISRYFTW